MLYRGYSSENYQNNRTFQLTDVELVKRDILNHIHTSKGERVMMPNFGTRIPQMVFEPLDHITLSIIEEDLNSVIANDPRVQLLSLSVLPDYNNNAIVASLLLKYIELNMTEQFELNIIMENN